MGDGSHSPGAVNAMLRVALLLWCCAALSGCWDFVEPDLPAEAGVSVLQVSAFLQDDGRVQISALLAPGIDQDGFRRRILNDTLGIFDVRLPPTATRASGTREYFHTIQLEGDAASRPFTVDPPLLENVPVIPHVRWFGVRKLGADTVLLPRTEDLVLRVDADPGVSTPPPGSRSWSLELSGAGGTLLLSGSGLPPEELRIPDTFLPHGGADMLRAVLVVTQSSTVRAPNFRGNYGFIVRNSWIIQLHD